jgi:hypothetical protein
MQQKLSSSKEGKITGIFIDTGYDATTGNVDVVLVVQTNS